jgi:hypothetical protein
MEHTNVVVRDPTNNLTLVCSIVWKFRIIQYQRFLFLW